MLARFWVYLVEKRFIDKKRIPISSKSNYIFTRLLKPTRTKASAYQANEVLLWDYKSELEKLKKFGGQVCGFELIRVVSRKKYLCTKQTPLMP